LTYEKWSSPRAVVACMVKKKNSFKRTKKTVSRGVNTDHGLIRGDGGVDDRDSVRLNRGDGPYYVCWG